jgi:hypothetical protein
MTLPANNNNNDPLPQSQSSSHYQPAPYNFSRPHPQLPGGSGSSTHSGHTLDGSGGSGGGHIGVTGAVPQGTKTSEGGINGRVPSGQPLKVPSTASSNHSTPDRDVRLGGGKDSMKPSAGVPPPPGTDASYFPPATNGSAVHSAKPSSIPVSINSTTKPVEHLQQPYSHPGSPPTRLSPPIPSMGTPAAGSSSQAQQQQQQPVTGSIRQRHTLQIPKPQQGSRTSTPASGSDAVASGRFSPTTPATTPRRQSMTLGRRPTRSIHSDNHLEEIPPDEDAARWTEAIKAKRASRRRKDEEGEDDKVVVGTKVDHNHVNWVTAYNMLTGIRFCVSRINAKMDRPLSDADFVAKHKFSFDV